MKSILALAALAFSLSAAAEQKLFLNGEETTGKVVTQMAFSGNDVILTYDSGTTETLDMQAVEIVFGTVTALHSNIQMSTLHTQVGNTIVVSGTEKGDAVEVYSLSGQKIASTVAASDQTTLSLGNATKGIYLLKVGNSVVKFIKK